MMCVEDAGDVKMSLIHLHTYIHLPPFLSPPHRCIKRANEKMRDLLRTYNHTPPFTFIPCGAVMIARNDDEDQRLNGVVENAAKNGVDVRVVTRDEIAGVCVCVKMQEM